LPRIKPKNRFKWGIALGVGLGALGGLLIYLWRRNRLLSDAVVQNEVGAAQLPAPIINPPPIVAPALGAAILDAPEEPLPQATNARPTIRSYVLPAPGAEAVRLVSSADRPYKVMVRVVDPPGAFAVFSFDASSLNNATAVPTGENIIIPVGQWQTIPMPPRSALYGRGSGASVTVSVTGSPV
jgi:hypothetical protein